MVHMLERAREVHKINEGETGRDSVVKCPFCIADEDEQWFRFKFLYSYLDGVKRPKRMPAPHCQHCPLQSLLGIDYTMFMNDCVEVGFDALAEWEGVHDD
jgi:hypothetical protein